MQTAIAIISMLASVMLAAPLLALPEGWHSADIGPVQVAGQATWEGAEAPIRISGSGKLTYQTSDTCHFVYRRYSGNFVATVRVSSPAAAGTSGDIGIMVRPALAPDAPFVLAGASPDGMKARWTCRRRTGY